jgi:hypothetical protein
MKPTNEQITLIMPSAEEADAGLLEQAAAVLRARFGVLMAGDLISGLTGAAASIRADGGIIPAREQAGGQPTMRDVATRSGTSLKTVSRVVNGEPGATPETAARVRLAVTELGFQVNEAARSLRYGRRKPAGEQS